MPTRKKRNKLPQVGAIFTKVYKGDKLNAKVVEVNSEAGTIKIEVNGTVYNSPTAAAKAFVHYEVDGWIWWHIDQ